MRTKSLRRFMAITVAILLATFALAGSAQAGAVTVFKKTFNTGESGGTSGYDVATDPGNGNVYVLTRSGCCLFSNMDTVAYSKTGTKLWSILSSTATPDADRPIAITVDKSTHDVIVTGTRRNSMVTQVYSATGTKLWSVVHGTTGFVFTPVDLVVDGHGRVIIAATSQSGGNEQYFTIAYTISTGTKVWSKSFGTAAGADEAAGVAADPGNDQVYVTGGSQGTNFLELTTVAYNGSTGAQLWAKHDTGNDDTATAVVVNTSNHDVFAVTETSVTALAIHTFAFDSSGNPLWDKEYVSPQSFNASPETAAVDSGNGQVYVGGEQRTADGGAQTILLCYSSTGTQLFVHIEHSGLDDIPRGVAVDTSNHDAYLAATRADSVGNLEFAVFADTAAGARAWEAFHQTSTTNGSSDPSAIAVDSSAGQVYVVGTQSNNNGNTDAITIAYTAAGN